MNNTSKVALALGFSAFCGVIVGSTFSQFIGIPLGWLLGCIVTFITGLFFYKPAEMKKYTQEAWGIMLQNLEEMKTAREMILLSEKRIRRARHVARTLSLQYTLSAIFDRSIFLSSWLMLPVVFLNYGAEFFLTVNLIFVIAVFATAWDKYFEIRGLQPDYTRRTDFFSDERKITRSFTKKLGGERGWFFLTLTKKYNPISILFKTLCLAYKHKTLIALGTGIFLLEMLKKINSHERIVIAVFGVTFCLIGLTIESLSQSNFAGPLVGLIGGMIIGVVEQIIYKIISDEIDMWISEMRNSLSLATVKVNE